MTKIVTPVVLCGGSGSRLWPLSREAFPKQFAPLIGGKSLLETTLERVKHLAKTAICVANNEHRFLVQQATNASGMECLQILEPAMRNTAAAMVLAAIYAQGQSGDNTLLLFMPADHFIPDAPAFAATVHTGIDAALAGYFVTFGVQPTAPSTAYGYIQQGQALTQFPAHRVERFIEKPNAEKAVELLASGDYFWNAGVFLVEAGVLIAAMQQHAPDILTACQQAMAAKVQDGAFIRPGAEAFLTCRSESIDYAVLEHYDKVAMIPFHGAWSDVGSWNAVANLSEADSHGNRVCGKGYVLEAGNTYINAPHRPVVALGTQDLLIVDTADALLVAATSHTEDVRQVVAMLVSQHAPEARQHRRVARPWGEYDSVDIGERHQVKRILVRPGASLSLQMHYHRAEHWVVVKGTALVTKGGEQIVLSENQSTYIPLGVKHRLQNPGKTDLELIEVQSGSYLGEDDIVRFEDNYGRK